MKRNLMNLFLTWHYKSIENTFSTTRSRDVIISFISFILIIIIIQHFRIRWIFLTMRWSMRGFMRRFMRWTIIVVVVIIVMRGRGISIMTWHVRRSAKETIIIIIIFIISIVIYTFSKTIKRLRISIDIRLLSWFLWFRSTWMTMTTLLISFLSFKKILIIEMNQIWSINEFETRRFFHCNKSFIIVFKRNEWMIFCEKLIIKMFLDIKLDIYIIIMLINFYLVMK